jgi:phosphoribosylamine---glycine ligase
MRVLLVGSGGREHALAWKLAQSPAVDDLHAAPGSPGIAVLSECHPIRAEDAESLLGLSHSLGVDLVVVGPEAPLVAGVADVLRHAGIAVFGPSAVAARIHSRVHRVWSKPTGWLRARACSSAEPRRRSHAR